MPLANDGLTVPAKEKIEGRVVDVAAKRNLKAYADGSWLSAAAIVITLIVLLLPGMFEKQYPYLPAVINQLPFFLLKISVTIHCSNISAME